MPYGDSTGWGDMGWSGIPAVSTTANGTGASNAANVNLSGGNGSLGTGTSSKSSCALCSNPLMQECLFALALILIAVGWHFHLFSMLEDA